MGRIKLQKLENTRDLGGLVTADGRKIKEKKLIRSGELFKATERDKAVLLNEYEMKTIVDFRTETERDQKPDPELDGVNYVFDPILKEKTLGITRERSRKIDMPKNFKGVQTKPMEFMRNLYRGIVLDEHSQKGYAKFFDVLYNQKNGSVLWHCAAGKDRVGVATALLLTVLGVDRKTIIDDYLLTDTYYRRTNFGLYLLLDIFVWDKNAANHLKYLLAVKPEYMQAAFEAIEENYGSVENYLVEAMDFSLEKQEALRKKYLTNG